MNGSEVMVDSDGVSAVLNTSPVGTESVIAAMAADPALKSIADALGGWVERTRNPYDSPAHRHKHRIGGLLDRDRWLNPDSAFEKIKLAREAMRDDIVSTAADGTEAFALSKTGVYADDEDEEDFWNLWAGDINLDDVLRKMWRVLFSDSQCTVLSWWGRRDFPLQGTTESGNQRRKVFTNMLVPVGLTLLDTTKIVPIGNLMFGQERLAYRPTPQEALRIENVLFHRDNPDAPPDARPIQAQGFMRHNGQIKRVPTMPVQSLGVRQLTRRHRPLTAAGRRDIPASLDAVELDDPLINQLFVGRYYPDTEEMRLLQEDGVPVDYLFEMRSDMVFRHCLTRPDFYRFAEVRLESIFELLDMKSQLRQLDRVTLVGGSHFIIVITKGTDKLPAEQVEIDALKAQSFSLASVPVIVGDHRLKVEILTPKQDMTLHREKWDTIDDAIFARVWSTFKHDVSRTEDPLKTAKVIAKNLESRRLMLRRTLEREIIDRIRRANSTQLSSRAKVVFTPQSISLNFDAAWASFLMDLRMNNEISRNTILGQFDLSQDDEARMRKREKDSGLDKIFGTLAMPGANPAQKRPAFEGGPEDAPVSPGPGAAKTAQRAAGRRARGGGGAPNDGTGRGQPARRARHTADSEAMERFDGRTILELGRDELVEWATDLEIVGRHKMRAPQLRRRIREELSGTIEDEEGEGDE
jgi:hypothetical protein